MDAELVPGRWMCLVADEDGTRAAVDRNTAISELRRRAAASNIGDPAMVLFMVPAGTEDAVADLLKATLDEGAAGPEGGES